LRQSLQSSSDSQSSQATTPTAFYLRNWLPLALLLCLKRHSGTAAPRPLGWCSHWFFSLIVFHLFYYSHMCFLFLRLMINGVTTVLANFGGRGHRRLFRFRLQSSATTSASRFIFRLDLLLVRLLFLWSRSGGGSAGATTAPSDRRQSYRCLFICRLFS
jgi:hypothetical protein